mmetsp:Transcript_12006/g.29546  ORF Transcript_12006/g.29546 Transcript_12006/m.29546 type:complete len:216 (+) Transcript_12006:383-1030(+)
MFFPWPQTALSNLPQILIRGCITFPTFCAIPIICLSCCSSMSAIISSFCSISSRDRPAIAGFEAFICSNIAGLFFSMLRCICISDLSCFASMFSIIFIACACCDEKLVGCVGIGWAAAGMALGGGVPDDVLVVAEDAGGTAEGFNELCISASLWSWSESMLFIISEAILICAFACSGLFAMRSILSAAILICSSLKFAIIGFICRITLGLIERII